MSIPDTLPPADAAQEAPEAPPWGDDFDAARAWTLVQNLRSDKAALKEKLEAAESRASALEAEANAAADEKKSEAEKLADRLAAAEQAAKEAQRALYIERARATHGLDEELLEFLTGSSEDEILAQAEKLAKRAAPAAPPESEPTLPPLPERPRPNLTPGHGGELATPVDIDEIATAARRRI